jgi:Right handed beta helix region
MNYTSRNFNIIFLGLIIQLFIAMSSVMAESFYVRPTQLGGYGTGDGLSYNNAFNGLNSLGTRWGGGTGLIGAGDTLWVIGTHVGETLYIQASGNDSNSFVRIRGDFNLSDLATIDGNSYVSSALRIEGQNYIKVSKVKVRNSLTNEVLVTARYNNVNGIVLEDLDIDHSLSNSTSVANTVWFRNTYGLEMKNIFIKNCTIKGTQQAGVYINSDVIAITGVNSGALIENNIIHNGRAEGIDIEGGYHHIVRYNKIYNCMISAAKFHSQSKALERLELVGNLFYGSIHDVVVFFDCYNSDIINNVFYHIGSSQDDHAMKITCDDGYGYSTFTNTRIINNIFVSAFRSGVVRITDATRNSFEADNTLDHNIYYNYSTDPLAINLIVFNIDLYNCVTENNFSDWAQDHTGSLNADPEFVYPSAGSDADYRIHSYSPARNAGYNDALMTTLILENIRDIGRYEYGE